MSELKIPEKNYAFIDGSFNPETKVYGCGGFLVDQDGDKHIIMESDDDENFAKMRNVAGELLGARIAVAMAYRLGMKSLQIFYDYDGVANWVTGKWRCKKQETLNYRVFMRHFIKQGLTIAFSKVRGHAGILENEEADELAKRAVGIVPRRERVKERAAMYQNDCDHM